MCSLLLQILNHVGALNLPDWWNAGKVAQQNSPIPFSESPVPARKHILFDLEWTHTAAESNI